MNESTRVRRTLFGLAIATSTIVAVVGCSSTAGYFEACDADTPCEEGAVCSPVSKTCVGLRQEGAPCSVREDCTFACRKGTCARAAELDEVCSTSDDCNPNAVCAKFTGKPEGVCLATCATSDICFGSNKKCCTSPDLPTKVCANPDVCK